VRSPVPARHMHTALGLIEHVRGFAGSRSAALAKMLLRAEADPNAVDSQGISPLHIATGSVRQWRKRAHQLASVEGSWGMGCARTMSRAWAGTHVRCPIISAPEC